MEKERMEGGRDPHIISYLSRKTVLELRTSAKKGKGKGKCCFFMSTKPQLVLGCFGCHSRCQCFVEPLVCVCV